MARLRQKFPASSSFQEFGVDGRGWFVAVGGGAVVVLVVVVVVVVVVVRTRC